MDKTCLPYFCVGPVVKGFGRGSKDLGCPTGKSHSVQSIFNLNETFHVDWFIWKSLSEMKLNSIERQLTQESNFSFQMFNLSEFASWDS